MARSRCGRHGTAIGLGGGLALGRPVHDQSSEQKCPTAHDVSSQLMTSIGAKNRQLDLTSTLEVQMKSVNPPEPDGIRARSNIGRALPSVAASSVLVPQSS